MTINQMIQQAELDRDFAEAFLAAVQEDADIREELEAYLETGNFTCENKVEGYSVLDIMIWQMDHFKAWLDRDTSGTKENKDRMVLLAFDTLLKMKKAPELYVRKMQAETGTDYAGKSFYY